MSSIAARRANKRAYPLQPNGILSRGTHGILAQMGQTPWGVVTFEKMTQPEAVSTLVLTNTSQ